MLLLLLLLLHYLAVQHSDMQLLLVQPACWLFGSLSRG
jgi:hypothetical protein